MLGFPDLVNEKAARVVAGGVAIISVVTLVTGWHWLLVPMAVGFLARVLTGPKLSPLGQLATEGRGTPTRPPEVRAWSTQALRERLIGLVITSVAAVASLSLDQPGLGAGAPRRPRRCSPLLESVAGLCVGCWVFALLMRLGLIPERTCVACADIWNRA